MIALILCYNVVLVVGKILRDVKPRSISSVVTNNQYNARIVQLQ